MLKSLRRAVVPGVVAVTFAAGTPALADTYTHTDARHDVETVLHMQRAPHNRKSDITHLRIVHNDRDVRFYIRFRDAGMKGVERRTFMMPLKTPKDAYTVYFDLFRGGEQDDLWDGTTETQISCDQTTRRHGHVIMLRVNRACLGKPRWIRASVFAGTMLANKDSRMDNALSSKWRAAERLSGPFSPRVRSST